ncbi:hypothetical protein L0U88_17220 [Flavihumibacter sp. RY-1]|uniref:Uncharacterized protein n=1 Tax=Flavihumibacter fluminis TaxID=2909236 RepID=A0ABS9BL37_9BACT|nr:hypothetical protein [Flavihumibacter fluminis]MCF1716386.1 hypothetical protein [Flavihumibacter fluminis]
MILQYFFQKYQDYFSWKTKCKIVVFESDDWGTIRMPSTEAIKVLGQKNKKLYNDPYSLYDSLENSLDLESLFDVLQKHKTKNNQRPIFTFNTIVANPDFEMIRNSNFNSYHFERFTDTISRLNSNDNVLRLWKEGVDQNFIFPQFHGREHVNVLRWLSELRNGNKNLLEAFDWSCFSVPYFSEKNFRKNLMASLDHNGIESDYYFQERFINEGQALFKSIFGFNSKSFIAPAYIWDSLLHQTMYNADIRYLQGIAFQYIPSRGSNFKRVLHYNGQSLSKGLKALVRNVFFEPSLHKNLDVVGTCLKRINKLFNHNRPVIIGSHRLNYIGSLNEKNRINNLNKLDELLGEILKRWPDVLFLSSDQLGDLISNKNIDSEYFRNAI